MASCVVWLADVADTPSAAAPSLRATLRSIVQTNRPSVIDGSIPLPVAGLPLAQGAVVGYLWLKLRSTPAATLGRTKLQDTAKVPIVFDPTVWALRGEHGSASRGIADDDVSSDDSSENLQAFHGKGGGRKGRLTTTESSEASVARVVRTCKLLCSYSGFIAGKFMCCAWLVLFLLSLATFLVACPYVL